MNLIPINSPRFIVQEQLDALQDWSLVFRNKNSLVLEIGCGIGDFITEMATMRHEQNFIAIDYYNKGCLKTCKRLDKAGLENVRVVRAEACDFMVRFIQPRSLQGVIINCPDPWPKKRHRKRRLVNAGFVEFLGGFLVPGADFFFSTDFDDYGEDVAKMMNAISGYDNCLSPDPYRHELAGYPLSKYMRKFMAEGKRIYFVHYRKIEAEEEYV